MVRPEAAIVNPAMQARLLVLLFWQNAQRA
jgi:hypothetical protein